MNYTEKKIGMESYMISLLIVLRVVVCGWVALCVFFCWEDLP